MPHPPKTSPGLALSALLVALVAFLGGLAAPGALAADEPVLWLTPGRDRIPVSPHLGVLEDPGRGLTIQEVSSPQYQARFDRIRGEGLSSGLTEPTTYWLRLTYARQETADEPETYYFDLGQMTKAFAVLYAMDPTADVSQPWREQHPLVRSGQAVTQPSQFTHFPLPPPWSQPQTVFLRVQVPLDLEAIPEVSTQAGFQRRLLEQDLFSGALLGIFAVLVLDNLIIFFTLRYAGYLWYALLLLGFSLQVVLLGGLLQDFAPQAWFNQITGFPAVALGLVGLSRLLFVRSFLPLKTYFPLGDRLILAMIVFYLPVVVWPFIWPTFPLMLQVYAGFSLVGVLFAMYVGIVCWRKGYAPARFFVWAYLSEMVGRFFMFIGYFGLWSPLPITSFHVQDIGVTIEAILLSLALVQRVNTLGQERERIEQEAQRKNAEHQERLRGLAGELVRSEERQRKTLADDLHDGISQNLATSLFSLGLISDGSQEAKPPLQLPQVCDLLRATLEQTRTLTFDISPPVLHDYGLEAALDWLAERVRERHGLAVSFRAQCSLPERDESLEANLFRAAQELLNNVVKHSGATRAEVSLSCLGNQVWLRVSDNGRGLAEGNPTGTPGGGGFGLFSIRERLRALGGELVVQSTPGQGCVCTLRTPWPERKPA